MGAGIYKLTSPSGKCYIGQSLNIRKRMWNYRNLKCNNQPKIYNAIKKYGWDNFIIENLFEIDRDTNGIKEILDSLEIKYIKKYDSIKNGYNLMQGGANGTHSKETLIKLSKAATGRKLSKESIAKRTASVLGSKRSDETRLKMSIAQLGKKMPKHVRENINKIVSKPVIQMSSDGIILNEYPSIAEAARNVNRHPSSISDCINGINKHCAGFIWKLKT